MKLDRPISPRSSGGGGSASRPAAGQPKPAHGPLPLPSAGQGGARSRCRGRRARNAGDVALRRRRPAQRDPQPVVVDIFLELTALFLVTAVAGAFASFFLHVGGENADGTSTI